MEPDADRRRSGRATTRRCSGRTSSSTRRSTTSAAGFTPCAPGGPRAEHGPGSRTRCGRERSYNYGTYRPQHQATANASYFFNTGSIGHELKFGFGYRHIIGGSATTWPGNQDVNYLNYNGSGQSYVKLCRNLAVNETMTYYDAYLGDTLTANNLTVNVGIRYDDQKGFNAPSSAPGNNSVCDPEPGVLAHESVYPGAQLRRADRRRSISRTGSPAWD